MNLPQSAELSPASKPEIEEGLLKKQEEAQEEPNPANIDSDATRTTLEEQIGENMERRGKGSYVDDEEANSIPERSSCDDEPKAKASCDDEQKGKAHGRRDPVRDSESGHETSDKRKGSLHIR